MRTTILCLLLAMPASAHAQAVPPPEGFYFVEAPASAPPEARVETEERTQWALVAPGLASLVVGYAGWAITAITWSIVNTECTSSGWGLFPTCGHNGRGANGSDALLSLIPLAGPWMSVGMSDTLRGPDLAFPIVAGLAQAAGLITLIVGLAAPETREVEVGFAASPDGGLARVAIPF